MAQDQPGILTEVGTNELEVVEFAIDQRPYAINVAKVREIIRPVVPMTVPDSHPCVLGVFRNRDEVLPLALGRALFEAAPEPKAFIEVAGAGHNDLIDVDPSAFHARVATFIADTE